VERARNDPLPKRILIPIDVGTDQGPATLHTLLDSGAELNLISQRVVDSLGLTPYDKGRRQKAYALGDHRLTLHDPYFVATTAKDTFDNQRTCHDLFWGANFEGFDLLLGYPWLCTANPIPLWGRGEFVWGPEDDRNHPEDDSDVEARITIVTAEQMSGYLASGDTVYAMYPVAYTSPHDTSLPYLGGDPPEPRDRHVRAAFRFGDGPSNDRDPGSYLP
jgi:hypothetical protein